MKVELIFKWIFSIVNEHQETAKSIMLYFQAILFIGFYAFLYNSAKFESKIIDSLLVDLQDVKRGQKSPADMQKFIERIINERAIIQGNLGGVKKSKIVELWDHYKRRVSELGSDERINVEPLLGADILYAKLGRRIILDHVGGTMIALGILFTFIGLAAGVTELQISENFSDSQDAVNNLLKGVGIAFSTSVFGVFLSLLWTFFDKKAMQKFEECIYELAEKFDYLLSVDEEEVFLNRMEKIAKEQKESIRTAMMDALNAPVFHSMNEQMSQQTGLIQQQLELTEKNSQNMAEKIIGNTTSGMQQALNMFVQNMESARNMQSDLLSTVNYLKEHYAQSQQQNAMTVERTEQLLGLFEKMTTEMDGMRDSYKNTAEVFGNLSGSLTNLQTMTADQLPKQEGLLQTLADMSSKFDGLMNGFTSYQQKVDVEIDERFAKLVEQSDTMFSQFNKMTGKFNEIVTSQENSLAHSNNLVKEIKGMSEKISPLANAFDNIALTILEVEKQFIATNQVQQELTKALSESRIQTDEVAKKALDASQAHLSEVKKQLTEMADRNLEMQNHWKQTEATFKDTNDSVHSSLREFKEDIENVLGKTFEHYDTELSKAVSSIGVLINQLNATNQELADTFADMTDFLEKMPKGMRN
jgi:chromosome segregation ATPase